MWIPLLWRGKVQPRASATSAGGARNSNPEIRSMPLILNGLLEGLARLESRNLPSLYLHPLSGLRVFTLPGLLLPDVELPEARQLDLLARLECLCYGRRESFEVFSGFALWRVGVLDHPLYELLFVHGCFPPCLVMLTTLSTTLGSSAQTCEASWLIFGIPAFYSGLRRY